MLQRSLDETAAGSADIDACRALLKNGSKTFHAASFLLPRRIREPASALYAFCRLADDAVDMGGHADEVLQDLRKRLDRAYQGRPVSCPADRALAAAVERFSIPQAVPEALIEGFAWDFAARRYETLHDLEAYAARVAGTVGVMMTMIMGVREPAALARACDLGIAMQLTNIARDVGEDARNGRLYLPLQWLEEEGVDAERWLTDPVFDERIAAVVARLLGEARRLYVRSEGGLAYLPRDCRSGIRAARLLYAEIGEYVAAAGYDSVSRRAVVPMSRKLALLVRAHASRRNRPSIAGDVVVEAARFLTCFAADTPAQGDAGRTMPAWWNLPERIAWVIDLFERLERCERHAVATVAHSLDAEPAYAQESSFRTT